ncbi:ninjurin-1, partial [Nephila pilipes]
PSKKLKKPLDNNIYSTKKTVAQGMMDLALLTANASQLKLLLKYNQEKSSIFFIHVSCICISITLQIIVGVMLILNSRYDINRPSHHSRADLMNNLTVIGIFLVTVVNVIAASFSDST